jgi:hypothetical protein
VRDQHDRGLGDRRSRFDERLDAASGGHELLKMLDIGTIRRSVTWTATGTPAPPKQGHDPSLPSTIHTHRSTAARVRPRDVSLGTSLRAQAPQVTR